MGFTHLRAVSGYSARYGASLPDALAERAAERGLDALALTDRDTVAGVIRFAKACARVGVRPLFGVDLAVADYQDVTAPARPSGPATTIVRSRSRSGGRAGSDIPTGMTVEDADQDKVSEWATECRNYTSDVLQQLGHPADLLQTDPGAAVGFIEEALAQEPPAPQTPEERVRLHTLLTAFLAEFLISAHRAHWTWIDDQASPARGRWFVSGFAHPLGQQTSPVDVGALVANALTSASTISLIELINQAELTAAIRVLRGARP